jgi:Flp pilus assembly protein TadB
MLQGGAGVREPRDLTELVPNEVRAELAVAVAVLEQHGPAVSEALRQLDQATTAARQALDPIQPTEDEGRLVEARHRDRPWLGGGLPAGVDA